MRWTWLWLLWLGFATGGGGVLAAPVSIVDDAGVQVSMAAPPARIVSLLPSLTEAVCVLQACDRLVGVDRWSNWPASVRRLPRLGGLDDAPLERIVGLRPDLVLLSPSTRMASRLRQLGLVVAEVDAHDLKSVERLLIKVSTLLGDPQQGERQWAEIVAALEAAARSVPVQARGRSVYVEISSAPHAAGTSSYLGQMLAQQGARNIVPASEGPFPKLNPEFVVRARPELIVVSADEVAGLRQRPGWGAIPAVQQGRICALSPTDMDAMSRPGPRLPDAARVLASCLLKAWGTGAERSP